ncbi:MAG: ATP-binding cassette domain-containing protein [Actinomycetaceae bacterium]|nr:ATP-binding cassette domain-containing protein [Actinomycetaceae bacterium]
MISLRNLTKRYMIRGASEVVALEKVNLDVNAGAIHGIVGQSGAGKSTLIRCLTALERPTEGEVHVAGTNLARLRHNALRKERRKIGMVFQSANLLDARTAAQNIAYPLQIAGKGKKERLERAHELLDLVGLGGRGDSYPAQLSGGQRQRVGIARALADQPRVVLCDEPTSALDADSTRQILRLLERIRDEMGVTIVIITHEMSVVREICDSATLLENGRVIETGTIEQIVSDPNSKLARELVPMPSLSEIEIPNGTAVVNVMFTSRPGIPTGATVLSLASRMGADVAAGTFETLANIQVGRLALTVPKYHVDQIVSTLEQNDIHTEVLR